MTASKITGFHFCNLCESACAQEECMVATSHAYLLSTTHVGALSGGGQWHLCTLAQTVTLQYQQSTPTTACPEGLRVCMSFPFCTVRVHSGRHGENLVLWETVEELINCLGICCISSLTSCAIHYNA